MQRFFFVIIHIIYIYQVVYCLSDEIAMNHLSSKKDRYAQRKDIMPKNFERSVKHVFNQIDVFSMRLSGISLNRLLKRF